MPDDIIGSFTDAVCCVAVGRAFVKKVHNYFSGHLEMNGCNETQTGTLDRVLMIQTQQGSQAVWTGRLLGVDKAAQAGKAPPNRKHVSFLPGGPSAIHRRRTVCTSLHTGTHSAASALHLPSNSGPRLVPNWVNEEPTGGSDGCITADQSSCYQFQPFLDTAGITDGFQFVARFRGQRCGRNQRKQRTNSMELKNAADRRLPRIVLTRCLGQTLRRALSLQLWRVSSPVPSFTAQLDPFTINPVFPLRATPSTSRWRSIHSRAERAPHHPTSHRVVLGQTYMQLMNQAYQINQKLPDYGFEVHGSWKCINSTAVPRVSVSIHLAEPSDQGYGSDLIKTRRRFRKALARYAGPNRTLRPRSETAYVTGQSHVINGTM
ncbi:hypothetical protein EYF80_011152 [Liparis tanakae]|uniref:Uncharacterized protein n=1 Tax=Liparis tanakae TaxID=230148 RepID=A0A4Z2ILC1_9TELE|nr:hypothetical protein EYF80_011152 [Liparis tanakae]